ncbi:MAG: hypothetical protein CML66_15635 [Rhodobacteraceae bacterium]|nr:hypothetical protein [Paracoccaceae bacterium]MAY44534.1 hypothetical protein [Paracoccaceae bacterium]QEW18241.1 hypothetical protein LA6_000403 [Marinibacterium anthonyi]
MVARLPGAIVRALLVALLVSTPALLLPPREAAATDIVLLLAGLGGLLTLVEYTMQFPSLVEFRDAPPVNRLRFAALFCMVFFLTLIFNHTLAPSSLTAVVHRLGELIGGALDFPYSPVHLAVLMLPADESPAVIEMVRGAAGLVYLISLVTIALFLGSVHLAGWPSNAGVFNVWINLPLFDPTTGGDVIQRLQRDGRVNIVLGALLPFVIPAMVKLASVVLGPVVMSAPNVLIWLLSAWAFLPASMILRGIALIRVAELIANKRRRACEQAKALQTA